MTTIYEAILKAADHIEQFPREYSFMSCETPACGTRGCLLGWIGYFLGMPVRSDIDLVAKLVLKDQSATHMDFYGPLTDSYPDYRKIRGSYQINASLAATCMRHFASEYHAPSRVFTGLPDTIRQIFDVETA